MNIRTTKIYADYQVLRKKIMAAQKMVNFEKAPPREEWSRYTTKRIHASPKTHRI